MQLLTEINPRLSLFPSLTSAANTGLTSPRWRHDELLMSSSSTGTGFSSPWCVSQLMASCCWKCVCPVTVVFITSAHLLLLVLWMRLPSVQSCMLLQDEGWIGLSCCLLCAKWGLGGKIWDEEFFSLRRSRNVERKVDISRLKSTFWDAIKQCVCRVYRRWTGEITLFDSFAENCICNTSALNYMLLFQFAWKQPPLLNLCGFLLLDGRLLDTLISPQKENFNLEMLSLLSTFCIKKKKSSFPILFISSPVTLRFLLTWFSCF